MYGTFQGLSDFVGGFSKESSSIRKEQQDQEDRDAAVEQRALEHLATADDPEIRTAAVTAMLTPKKSSGGSALQKWFGQQRSHPAYDQVQQLMGGGNGQPARQPFLSPEEKAAAARTGSITGAARGYAQGMREEGYEPTQSNLERVTMGAAGAPPPRPLASGQPGKITLEDGTVVTGSYDKASDAFYDADQNQLTGVIGFEPAATRAVNPSQGGAWKAEKDATSSTGWRFTHRDAAGKVLGQGGEAPSPPPEPLSPIQTPGGILSFGTKTGNVRPAPGGANVSTPAPPTADYETLRQSADDMYKRATATQPHFAGLPVNDAKLRPALDAEAKAAGYAHWADVQKRLGDAQRAVGGRVAPPPDDTGAPPEPIAPSPAGTPRRAAPVPGGPKSKKNPAAKPGQPGQLDIQRILQELNKF